jgi:hypothetical protein
MTALDEWFLVRFDNAFITLEVSLPNLPAWTAQIEWKHINRVCFKSGDLYNADEIYIFTDERLESYLIPTEANGGSDLWREILERKLFGTETAIEAATSANKLFCCPAIEE